MDNMRFDDMLGAVASDFQNELYRSALAAAEKLAAQIIEDGEPDPVQLGWVRFYQYKSHYELCEKENALALLDNEQGPAWETTFNNRSYMLSTACELAAQLFRPEVAMNYGRRVIELRADGSDRQLLMTINTVCASISLIAGRPDKVDNLPLELIERGSDNPGYRFFGYEHLRDKIAALGDAGSVDRLLAEKDSIESLEIEGDLSLNARKTALLEALPRLKKNPRALCGPEASAVRAGRLGGYAEDGKRIYLPELRALGAKAAKLHAEGKRKQALDIYEQLLATMDSKKEIDQYVLCKALVQKIVILIEEDRLSEAHQCWLSRPADGIEGAGVYGLETGRYAPPREQALHQMLSALLQAAGGGIQHEVAANRAGKHMRNYLDWAVACAPDLTAEGCGVWRLAWKYVYESDGHEVPRERMAELEVYSSRLSAPPPYLEYPVFPPPGPWDV